MYLFEDALDLWEETVKNAPTEIKEQEPLTGPEYTFMGLFPEAVACLQLGSENLKKILKIIESYLILDPVGIMQVIRIIFVWTYCRNTLMHYLLDLQGS